MINATRSGCWAIFYDNFYILSVANIEKNERFCLKLGHGFKNFTAMSSSIFSVSSWVNHYEGLELLEH